MKIGLVAASSRFDRAVAEEVAALAAGLYPTGVDLVVHPDSYLVHGHFAGDDQARARAFLDIANDVSFDALWFARGGYGACRITELVLPQLTAAAASKTYLGYSDAGSLLGALYDLGFPAVAHGPMPQDIRREGGAAAVARALSWLVARDPAALEGGLVSGERYAAFNIAILAQMIGAPWQPDLAGHTVLLEDVSEPMYRLDRALCQIASTPAFRNLAGVRLGRCSDIIPNDPDFEQTPEQVCAYWCERAGVAYLGAADIGHDAGNKVVPFGLF